MYLSFFRPFSLIKLILIISYHFFKLCLSAVLIVYNYNLITQDNFYQIVLGLYSASLLLSFVLVFLKEYDVQVHQERNTIYELDATGEVLENGHENLKIEEKNSENEKIDLNIRDPDENPIKSNLAENNDNNIVSSIPNEAYRPFQLSKINLLTVKSFKPIK